MTFGKFIREILFPENSKEDSKRVNVKHVDVFPA